MLTFVVAAALLGVAIAQSGRCNFNQNNETVGRIYMVKGDCTYYYQCNNGREYLRRPCKDDEIYNLWIGKCVSNTENVDCDISPDYYAKYDQLCSSKLDIVAVPSEPSKFVLCWKYHFRFPPMSCSNGLIFNQKKGICTHADSEVPSEQIENNVPEQNNDNRKFYDGYRSVYEADIIGNAACIYQPVPGDCTKYTYCSGGPEVVGQCAEGTVMSRSRKGCVYCSDLTPAEKAECQLRC
ncbi:hypothetical protein LOTGIDRAFT_234724, partial [Lottia gigantea]